MESKILNVALEQFEAKNYKHAMILFLSIANENVIAQYYLGAIYRLGLGVEDDQKEAISWFLKAAKQGHPESQFLVGCAYSCSYKQTDLVRYDHEEIERKQEEDFSIWQDTLSYFGLNGIGVEPDEAEAYKWISASADQNYVDAIVALGDMYCFGKCVEKNKNEAFKWYMKAALQENTIALQRLGLFFSDREGTGFKAIELLKRVYNLGDHYSAFLLGEAYEQVHKQNPDYHEAFRWYKISAEQYNNYESQYKLGEYYREGKVVEVDYNQAIRWYKKSIVSYRLQFKKSCFTEAYEKLHYLYVCGHEYALSDS